MSDAVILAQLRGITAVDPVRRDRIRVFFNVDATVLRVEISLDDARCLNSALSEMLSEHQQREMNSHSVGVLA